MRVEEKDVDRLIQSLSKKFRAGDKWVAFDYWNPTAGADNITTFKHIGAADEYCKKNTSDEYGTSEYYHYYYFNFQPILNLIKSLSGDGSEPKSTPNLDRLAEQIQEHSLIAAPFTFYHRAIFDLLADGMYHPVGVKQQILPWKDIESYVVIAHFYPKGMIYEIGHGTKSHGVFGNYYEAQKCFEQLMDKYVSYLDKPELKLIGKIKGQDLALDFEDFPQPGAGVLFKMANLVDGEGGERKYVAEQKANLDKPIDIVQHKMAKFNFRAASLEFFDGSLQKVTSGARLPFMDFSSLSTTPAEIIPSLKQTESAKQQLYHGHEKKHRQRFKP